MKTVAYYRVSTRQQGNSGLGIEAQRETVKAFLAGKGWPPVAEFVEIESGKRNNRPQLEAAIRACRVHRAKLIIAKLDRLSRNAAFLMALRDSGVEFVACDIPDANTLTVGVMALLAQQEREMISARTVAALAAVKARNALLPADQRKTLGGRRAGAHALSPADRAKALEARAVAVVQRAADLAPIIADIRASGIVSASGIARALNDRQIPTSRGGCWQAVQVQRLLARQ